MSEDVTVAVNLFFKRGQCLNSDTLSVCVCVMVVARFGIFFSSFFKNRKVVADVVLRVSYSVRHALTWRRPQHSWRPSDNYFLLVRPYRYKKWKKKKKCFFFFFVFCWRTGNVGILTTNPFCVCVLEYPALLILFLEFSFSPRWRDAKRIPKVRERRGRYIHTHTHTQHTHSLGIGLILFAVYDAKEKFLFLVAE